MTSPSHLDRLEAEAIGIIRETLATCERPVLLYSIGKDSSSCCISPARRSIRGGCRFRCCMSTRSGNSRRWAASATISLRGSTSTSSSM